MSTAIEAALWILLLFVGCAYLYGGLVNGLIRRRLAISFINESTAQGFSAVALGLVQIAGGVSAIAISATRLWLLAN
jgi:hypothetical protein